MGALRIGLAVCILVGCRIDGHYVFPEEHTLTVQLAGKGTGSVSSDPDGLTCSAGVCSGEFFEGTVVHLRASATTGSFLGWTEACRDRGNCIVTMDADRTMGALFGAPGESLWVKQLGSQGDDSGRSIALDRDGNLIAVGVFRQTTAAGPELTSNGEDDIYALKLAGLTGEILWTRRLGGQSSDNVYGVAVDDSNNIYIGGRFQGTVDFGGGPLTSVGPSAAFVLKLDTNEDFIWAQKIDEGDFGAEGAIVTDGNSVVIASLSGSLLKLSASTGMKIWGKSLGSILHDVALDSSGNVVITGRFMDGIGLMKLADEDGVELLSKQFGSDYAYGYSVAVDPANNILATGIFQGTVDFGCPSSLTESNALFAMFMVKYTQAGSCLWAKGFTGMAGLATSNALAVNSASEFTTVGEFCGSMSFGGRTFSSAAPCINDMDMFAARFDGEGMHLSSVRAGGTSNESGLGSAQASDGRFFVTGNFAGFAEFGGTALNAVGGNDAFIAAFPPL